MDQLYEKLKTAWDSMDFMDALSLYHNFRDWFSIAADIQKYGDYPFMALAWQEEAHEEDDYFEQNVNDQIDLGCLLMLLESYLEDEKNGAEPNKRWRYGNEFFQSQLDRHHKRRKTNRRYKIKATK